MITKVTGTCLAVLLTAVPTLPASAETALWKTVGACEIRVDSSLGHGCFMVGISEQHTVLRAGFNMKTTKMYFIVGSPAWKSLEVGKRYNILFRFDGQPYRTAEALAFKPPSSNTALLYIAFEDTRVFLELMRRNALLLSYRGQSVMHWKLTGSYAAGAETARCQIAINEARGRSGADPFSDPPGDDDPFAR